MWLLWNSLVACGPDLPDPVDDSGGAGGDTGSFDDEGDFFEPTYFAVRGAFGYDGTVRQYLIDHGHEEADKDHGDHVMQPWLEFVFVDETRGEDCKMTLWHGGGAFEEAPWVADAEVEGKPVWLGFAFPEGHTIDGNCFGWDMDRWGVVRLLLQQWTWGLAVHDIEPEVIDDSEDSLKSEIVTTESDETWDESWQPYVVGASIYSDAFDGLASGGYAKSYIVDEDFRVDEPIPRVEIDGGEPPIGFYSVSSWVPLDPELLLGE